MPRYFTLLLLFSTSVFSTSNAIAGTAETISATKADSIITQHFADPAFLIIDVRTASEYAAGHIPNSYNIDYNSVGFSAGLDTLDKSATYLMHCQSGARSAKALKVFIEKEFDVVYELQGGFRAWTYKTTTETDHQLFRVADAELAYTASQQAEVQIYNITDKESFELFNIPNSILIAGGVPELLDSIAELEKSTPILLYSSSNLELDTVFQNLFTDNYSIVYNAIDLNQNWIDAGYAYNTIINTEPITEPTTEPIVTEPITEPTITEPIATSLPSGAETLEIYHTENGLYIPAYAHETIQIFTISGIYIGSFVGETHMYFVPNICKDDVFMVQIKDKCRTIYID